MRRTIATFLVGSLIVTGQAAPVFNTGTGAVTMGGDFSGYINLGLQGVGRISSSQLDAFGETFGSVSGLQVTNWKATADGYRGSFLTLPDRGYNSGAVYSDYRARVQQVDFSFRPYTGAGPVAPTEKQFTLSYMGGGLVQMPDGTASTTGALPTSSSALQIGSTTSGFVPTTSSGKVAIDAEAGALFKDGDAYITDEYGPNIYYVKDGQIRAVINPPASAMPRATGGSLSFTTNSDGSSAVDPKTGRRSNQGMEAVAITPDGKTLFTMLQSATMQDSVSGAQNRQFTRLYKYDVSQSRTNPVLAAEYVVELPRFNDTKADQTGLIPNKVAAQSEIVALDGERLLLLARDGNGNGNPGVTPAVFKSVMLMDLGKGNPTDIASLDTTPAYSVIAGTVSSTVTSGTATLTDTTAKLNPAITPVSPVQFLNLIGQSDLSKFGLNTNDGSSANPRSAASLSEKWEGMALVSALDPAKPNDYFLFVANDNDFLTNNLKMKSTTGSISTTAGPLGVSVENDTMFLAYRLTLPVGAVDQSILTIGSAAASVSMAASDLLDYGSVAELGSGASPKEISRNTLVIPESMTVNRPIDVGVDGGGLNLLGHSVVLNGSVSGVGGLTVFGTSSGARLTLGGSNSFGGGLEINGLRVEASRSENLGEGQVNLNAGAVLSLVQSGTFSQDAGLYVGGGTMEVAAANEILWTGSVGGPGRLTKVGAGNLALTGASTFTGGLTVEQGSLTLGSSSLLQGETLVASPVGIGTLTLKGGTALRFNEQGIHLLNAVLLHPGADGSAPVLLDLGDNRADFSGPVEATAPVEIHGAPEALLTFSGTTSFSGDISVRGATVRLSESLAKAPGLITLRSGGGLLSLGNVQVSSSIVLEDEGRLDGGEGVLSISGDITGAGRLRITGSPYGTVRLEGLNTYSGGTSLEDTRVEIAVHGADRPTGLGGALGSGDVTVKNATLAFATPSRISNTLKLNGELTIDVADNVGELGGAIIDDVSGPGSLYVTGSSLGALMLSGTSNSYTGPTVVDGTTLRLLHTPETPGAFTLRSGGGLQSLGNVQVSSTIILEDEGRLDGGEGVLSISGDITGAGRLRITGSPYGTVRLEGLNTYSGGTSLEDTRVEIAVNGAEEPTGGGGALGSGDVTVKNATLAFATPSRISNTLKLNGELTVDVADNVGELGGAIIDDVSGPGSLYVTGSSFGALTLSGTSNSYTGPTVVDGTTLRLLHTTETPGTVTLRSGGGLQSLGNVHVSSTIILEDEGRLDGGEGVLSISGDITGAGRLRITGSPYGTVRLEGLNTYTGGTSVEETRVEVAVYGADDITGGAFGSGEVNFKNATLAFGTSSRISNALKVQGELTIDVDGNTAELGGAISNDSSGTGSLYITGNPQGVLMLSGPGNSYTGPTIVEGTTLRLLHTADTSLLGVGTQSSGGLHPIQLDGATLQIIPDPDTGAVTSATPVTRRDVRFGARGATLDVSDSSIVWSGIISGGDPFVSGSKLTVAGAAGSQIELSGANTYVGGTDVHGGVILKLSADENLGATGTPVTLSNGGLVYGGSGSVNWSRPLTVLEGGLIDVGSRTVTVTGALSGGGVLEVGRKAYEGSTFPSTTGILVVGSSAARFTGRTVVSGGSLLVSTGDALKNTTLETVANGGSVGFAVPNVSLGGLAGDGSLHISAAGTLSVGVNGMNTTYSGVLSGGSLTLAKVGSGNLSLGAVNTYSGPTNIQEGTLTLEMGADLGPAPISLSSKVALVINGAGRDLSTRFGSVAPNALVVFNGSEATDVLKLPSGFVGKTLNLGAGGIQIGTATATSGTTIGEGVSFTLTSLPSLVTLSGGTLGGTLDLSSSDGSQIVVNGSKSLLSTGTGDVVTVKLGGTVKLTAGLPLAAFKGTFQADGQVIVSPTNAAEIVDLPRLKGSGKVAIQGGSAVIVESPDFNGTTSISSGATAELTGSLGFGKGAALELAPGSNLRVVPKSMTEQVTLPSLSGGGSVSLQAGKVMIVGGNSAFSGILTVREKVDVTVRGDLPIGTINVVDPSLPLKVDSSAGNVSIPGTVTGTGGLMLTGGGTFTLTANAKIETAQLLVGGNASESPTLDVSGIAGGVLTLSGDQTLGGGGRIVGSVATRGTLAPGNSPGTLTIQKNSVVNGSGNLTVDAGARILIEYGQRVGSSTLTVDSVDVSTGVLRLHPSAKIVFSKFVDSGSWASFVTPSKFELSNVFKAGAIVSGTSGVTLSPEELKSMIVLDGNPLLSELKATTDPVSGVLSFSIEKAPYTRHVTSRGLQPLAQYLFAAGSSASSTGLAQYLSFLDSAGSSGELTARVAAVGSPMYSEAQRLSLRRTAAVSESVQGRLVRGASATAEGWSAWSEAYGWSFNRNENRFGAAWQGRNFGEVLGVQNTRAGLTLGIFGAAGYSNASFSGPTSSLKGDSYHGGFYAHAEHGSYFLDASFLAGSAEQTAVRNVSVGPVNGRGRARFMTGEFASHTRLGLLLPEVSEGLSLKPSFALLLNGYSQDGLSESGLGGVGVITNRASGTSWQTRLGFEAAQTVKAGGKPLDLLASGYWVRDANRGPRSVLTRFNGSSAAGYHGEGGSIGAHAFEVGVGAGMTFTQRTSARLNGVWQVREGSSQPGVNLGITVQF